MNSECEDCRDKDGRNICFCWFACQWEGHKCNAEITDVDEERDIMLKYVQPNGKNSVSTEIDVSCERISSITLQEVNHSVVKIIEDSFNSVHCEPNM